MLSNILRTARQPVVRYLAPQQPGEAKAGEQAAGEARPRRVVVYAATLSVNPRSLHVLWEEYKRGIGRQRAARLFTRAERGKVKHKYHRRKIAWDLISTLVRGGLTAQVAIDWIYDHYGRSDSVTLIINKMKVDHRNGLVFAL
jgi:hypothetical protein